MQHHLAILSPHWIELILDAPLMQTVIATD